MLPQTGGALCLMLCLLGAALLINEVHAEGRVVCYYTNWSVYRPGTAKFNPQNINPYLCTHLIYAFGGFTKDNQMKPFDKYQDIEQGGYAKFTGLKTYNKQLKTMIAIGGWNEASSRFSPLVANPERRQKFIKNILKFLRQNHFDGIDLDWEYPAHREGGKPRDRDNYAQFVQELRAEFEREAEKTGRTRLLLTMAVPAGIQYIEKGYDIPKLNKFLDWFNVLTYDFHSANEPSANHHAPLYSLEEESEYNYDADLNIDYSIKFYLEAGADRDKLVLGIPTYGRSFTLINEDSTEIGAPSEGPGEQGDATREKGYLAYYEICQNIREDPEWTVVQPNPNAMGPYAYRRNQWVGYDDEAIVRKKSQYVVDNGLGGIMFWSIDNDDFRGICSGKPYPLIEAAKEAMLDALGIGINEVSKSNAPQKPNHSRNRESTLSTRNRLVLSEEKVPRKRIQTTTTTAPSTTTTIKLTEVEGSSLYIGGRTTPPPPTTPDPGTDFKCEDEGFFQHPRDCKKYYWCLDSGPSGLGIVAHQFTCPSGLYFNPSADSCDFARNVPCKIKKTTTAVPVTKSTTVITTPKPSVAPNRITAATSRISYLRTTPRTTTTTTTTTEAIPESQEEEEEYEVEQNQPQRESEEDPKVIKELIDLIKRVGGIEELEKHLLRKDDGTISIKQHSSSSVESTTASSISKSLYDKVLSRPNAYNSFRNRFSNANILRQSSRTKSAGTADETFIIEDADGDDSKTTSSYSKYSSVVRGNSRQGPQNEGIEHLQEFEGFLKERKQYVTINRNRGISKTAELDRHTNNHDEDDDDDENENVNVNDRRALLKDDTTLEEPRDVKNFRSSPITTPTYVSIRRTRPSTTISSSTTTLNDEDDKQRSKFYTTISRNHNKVSEIEPTDTAEAISASSTKYKYLERTRPITSTTESITLFASRISDAGRDNHRSPDDVDDVEDAEDIEDDHQNTLLTPNTAAINSLQISRRPVLSVRKRLTNTTTDITATIATMPTISTSVSATLHNNHNPNHNEYNSNNNNQTNNEYLPIFTTTTTTTTATAGAAATATTDTAAASLTSTSDELLTITPSITAQSTVATTKAAATTINNYSKYNRLRVIRPLDATSLPSKQYLNNFNHHKLNASHADLALASSSLTTSSLNDIIGQQPNNNNNNNKKYRRYQYSPSSSTFSTASSSQSSSSSSSSSSSIGTLPTSIALRRKYQARRLTTTVTPANNIDDTEPPRTANPLFKRRPNTFKIPRTTTSTLRTTTTAALEIIGNNNKGGLIDNALSISHIENEGNKNKNHIIFEIAETNDQIAKSSVYTNHFNHLNQQSASAISPAQSSSLSSAAAGAAAAAATAATTIIITGDLNKEKDNNNSNDDNDDDDEDKNQSAITIIISTTPAIEQSTTKEQHTKNVNELVTSSGILNAKNQTKFSTKKRKTILERRQQLQQQQQQPRYKELDKTVVNERPSEVKKKINYGHSQANENRRRPHKYQALNESKSNNKIHIIPVVKAVTKAPTIQISNQPEHDYDYYDDEDVRVVGNKDQQLKVILHGGGIIECLDQGNFPHPLSCRKFISCAKFETGGVVGWEYTCPKGLSYDPVGGMCNWAAGLGCKE